MLTLNNEQVEFLNEMGVENTPGKLYQKMFKLQGIFDESLNKKRNINFSKDKYLVLNNFAILSELGEFLDELDWPWWKEKEFDKEGALNELRDLQHFILKMKILLGLNEESYIEHIKTQINKFKNSREVEVKEFQSDEHMINFYIEKLYRHTLDHQKTENELSESEFLTFLLAGSVTSSVFNDEDTTASVFRFQNAIFLFQKHLGYKIEDAFVSYVDKNIENHNRQKGKSKDATRVNYSDNAPSTTVVKEGESFIIKDEKGNEVVITKETLFEMNRL